MSVLEFSIIGHDGGGLTITTTGETAMVTLDCMEREYIARLGVDGADLSAYHHELRDDIEAYQQVLGIYPLASRIAIPF